MKIAYKLTGVFLLFTLAISVTFYVLSVRNQRRELNERIHEELAEIQASFFNLEEHNAQTLLAVLESIVSNPALKRAFLSGKRDELYHSAQPLYQRLKNGYGISHWYFIRSDGTVLLRMHDQYQYGDRITRESLRKTRETRLSAWEIELGKHGYALRAVMPYFEEGKIVGYIELGGELNHLVTMLKKETGHDFAIFADKQYLSASEWEAARNSEGKRNNWDDLTGFVSLGMTSESKNECFTERLAARVSKGPYVSEIVRQGKSSVICTGFPLKPEGRTIGVVLSVVDVTDHANVAWSANGAIVRTAVVFFVIMLASGLILSRSITRPVQRLSAMAAAAEQGNFTHASEPDSGDEIGELAAAFRAMLENRKKIEEALQQSEGKYRSLVESTTDSIYLVDRDYRYLFMNNNHVIRMGFRGDEYLGRTYGELHSEVETRWFEENVGRVFATGKSVQPEHRSGRDGRYFLQTLSPVKDHDGNTIAVSVVSKDITDLKLLEEKLHGLSITDELTGLYNRRGFFTLASQLLKTANREKTPVLVLYADLDGLKAINDSFGHKEGDRALVAMALILKQTFRDSDIIARIGGDEFALIPSGATQENFSLIPERLREALAAYNETERTTFTLSVSVGIACYNPSLPCTVDELLSRADEKMYEAKKKGGSS